MTTLNFAIIGCGGITLQNHLPGLALCPDVNVSALCDADPATLDRARQQTGVSVVSTRYEDIVGRDDIHAVPEGNMLDTDLLDGIVTHEGRMVGLIDLNAVISGTKAAA